MYDQLTFAMFTNSASFSAENKDSNHSRHTAGQQNSKHKDNRV